MSGGIPYVGSKISLISKAEIRYEGILYTIDPNESTVALAKVKSFGTEDRPTDRPVAPRDEVFEYIIFRGTDIKDIHVCEPPKAPATLPQSNLPQDPAIIKSSQPVTTGASAVPQPPGPSFTTPAYQPFGYQGYNQFGPGPVAPPQQAAQQAFNAAPAPPVSSAADSRGTSPPGLSRQSPGPGTGAHVKARPAALHNGSRGNSSPVQRKSPIDQGTQVTNNHHDNRRDDRNHENRRDDRNHENRRDDRSHDNRRDDRSHDNRRDDRRSNDHGRGQQERRDDRPQEARQYSQSSSGGRQQYRDQHQQNDNRQQYREQNDHYREDRDQHHQRPPSRGGRGSQGGGEHRGGFRGHRGGIRGGPRGGGGRGGQNRPRQEPLKFEGDFDFESSNAKFDKENIEKELKTKLVIGPASPTSDKVANGNEVKPEEQVESTPSEVPDEVDDKEEPVYYDKAKSFFDNISCEATEREKGINMRPNWREERKMNSETFGISSTSAYRRGGFRRGGFRGRGGGWRGGRGRPQGGNGQFRGGRGGGGGAPRGRRNQGWVDYDYNYEAAGINRKNQENKNVARS